MSQLSRFFTTSGPGAFVQTLTGNSGGPVPPTGGNINVIGTGVITVIGNPGTSTLTITPSGTIASSFPTDAGTATPVGGVLNVFGGTAGRDINTSGAGNTIHVDLNNAITLGDLVNITGSSALTLTTGDVTLSAGNINLPNTTVAGTAGEIKVGGTLYFNNFGTGGSNTFLGPNSGNVNVANTGGANNGFGAAVMGMITSGLDNTGMGHAAFQVLSTGSNNSAFGGGALNSLTTGSQNTAVGLNSAEFVQTGSNNTALGYNAGNSWGIASANNINIGNVGASESATIRIGTNGTHTSTFISGIDGVNVGSVAKVVTMASDQLGTATITAGTGVTVTPTANTITVATNTSAGNWVLIQSQIANNTSPNLDFTTGITSTYSSYAIIVSNLIPSLQANLFLLVSATGGAPYIVAGYQGGNAGVNTVSGAFSSLFTAVTTGFLLSDNVAGGSAFGSSGTYFLHGLTNGSEPMFTGTSFYDRIGNNWMTTTGGVVTTTNINALRVTASAGNLVSGRVTLYGIKEF